MEFNNLGNHPKGSRSELALIGERKDLEMNSLQLPIYKSRAKCLQKKINSGRDERNSSSNFGIHTWGATNAL